MYTYIKDWKQSVKIHSNQSGLTGITLFTDEYSSRNRIHNTHK